mgnify:CR=1 FL=1
MDYEYALKPGIIIKSKHRIYQIVEVLGMGGFGITYKVMSLLMVDNVPVKTYFAIKEHFMKGCWRDVDGCTVLCAPTVKKDVADSCNDFITEARRLNKLSGKSKNIVRVNEVFNYFNTAYYVMQYLEGGSLDMYIRKHGAMAENKAVEIVNTIANAVKILHKERLLHLDIKPDNIVLMTDAIDKTDYPVLIDFGIAKHFSSNGSPTTKHEAKGASDGYAPPEQYSYVSHFAPEMDIYALGATLLHLLSGKPPINSFEIRPETIDNMLPNHVSLRVRNAIQHSMKSRTEERTSTVEQFIYELTGGVKPKIKIKAKSKEESKPTTPLKISSEHKEEESKSTIWLYNGSKASPSNIVESHDNNDFIEPYPSRTSDPNPTLKAISQPSADLNPSEKEEPEPVPRPNYKKTIIISSIIAIAVFGIYLVIKNNGKTINEPSLSDQSNISTDTLMVQPSDSSTVAPIKADTPSIAEKNDEQEKPIIKEKEEPNKPTPAKSQPTSRQERNQNPSTKTTTNVAPIPELASPPAHVPSRITNPTSNTPPTTISEPTPTTTPKPITTPTTPPKPTPTITPHQEQKLEETQRLLE